MRTFTIHPRIESSLKVGPGAIVWSRPDLDEAYLSEVEDTTPQTALDFLLEYDFRGRNRFQQEENLEFLRLYFDRYPGIRKYFREDILVPQEMFDNAE